MLSKTQSKYIRSLAIAKFRQQNQNFIAEGEKIVHEWLLSAEKIEIIVGLQEWIDQNTLLIARHPNAIVHSASAAELKQISSLTQPNKALIVVAQKKPNPISQVQDWCIALDGIRDPGNMGTILRIADWFGIQHIVCSPDCVDYLSPKVVQAAMGAHLRIHIYEQDLATFITNSPLPALAAVLGGDNIYQFPKPERGILVIGNEGQGISPAVLATCQQQLSIPRMGGAESLNAAVSTGILCALLLGK